MKHLLIVQDWWDRIMQKKYFCFLFLVFTGWLKDRSARDSSQELISLKDLYRRIA